MKIRIEHEIKGASAFLQAMAFWVHSMRTGWNTTFSACRVCKVPRCIPEAAMPSCAIRARAQSCCRPYAAFPRRTEAVRALVPEHTQPRAERGLSRKTGGPCGGAAGVSASGPGAAARRARLRAGPGYVRAGLRCLRRGRLEVPCWTPPPLRCRLPGEIFPPPPQ